MDGQNCSFLRAATNFRCKKYKVVLYYIVEKLSFFIRGKKKESDKRMLHFQDLTLQEIELLRPYFCCHPSRICDSTIGGTFLWRDYFRTEYAIDEDTLYLRSRMPETEEYIYSVPMGGNVSAGLERLKAFCDSQGHKLILSTVSEEDLPAVQELWPQAQVETIPEWADYLYLAEDIKELPGKKYATQRNHISKFNRLYPEWTYEPITADNLSVVREFFQWFAETNEKDSETYRQDEQKAAEVLDNFATYGFIGGVVRAEDQVVAMALGEVLCDTLYVHIEKADIRYHGSYPMIVREFARHACGEGVQYINREDDAGDAGLRKSKLSWRPCGLLDKYLVHID